MVNLELIFGTHPMQWLAAVESLGTTGLRICNLSVELAKREYQKEQIPCCAWAQDMAFKNDLDRPFAAKN